MSVRWGIAGFGWVARDYTVPGIEAAGGRVVAVADPSPSAQAKAASVGIAAFDDVATMLGQTEVEALYVATPNNLHLPAVRAAAAAGIPVLCEKPMAASLADAQAMAAAIAVSGTLYGTAFDQRYHPAHRAIAEHVVAGAIGSVTAVRIVYACWVDPAWSPTGDANWRADPVAAGGGAVIDLALHGLDLAQMLVGEPLDRLHVALQRRVHDYAVDDGGMLTGGFAGGALFQAHVAYNCPEMLPRRRLEIIGSTGSIVAIDTMGQTPGGTATQIDGSSGARAPIAFDAQRSPFTAQAAAFADAVLGGTHDFSIERDVALMRLFDAAYREGQSWL